MEVIETFAQDLVFADRKCMSSESKIVYKTSFDRFIGFYFLIVKDNFVFCLNMFPIGKLINWFLKVKLFIILNKSFKHWKNKWHCFVWTVVEHSFSLRFEHLVSFKITKKKKNLEYFFQNGKDILPKSNNGIYEKVFQGGNNNIMTVWERGREVIEMDDHSPFWFYIVPATVLSKT